LKKACGECVGFEALGLGPEAGVSIVSREVIEQRVDYDTATDTGSFGNLDQAAGGVYDCRVVGTGPAQQEPCPFVLVTWLDDTAGQPWGWAAGAGEVLAHGACGWIQEACQHQLANFVREGAPFGGVGSFVPGKTRFEQVHVRVGLQQRAGAQAGSESAALASEMTANGESQALGFVPRLEFLR